MRVVQFRQALVDRFRFTFTTIFFSFSISFSFKVTSKSSQQYLKVQIKSTRRWIFVKCYLTVWRNCSIYVFINILSSCICFGHFDKISPSSYIFYPLKLFWKHSVRFPHWLLLYIYFTSLLKNYSTTFFTHKLTETIDFFWFNIQNYSYQRSWKLQKYLKIIHYGYG